jgi:DNA-binding NarL/FixJ family response regulator
MTIRVLVVDDHASWRSHVSSALQKNFQCEVIGEAADGLEAVQKAERLTPDLIVLDIGLPTINGIAVARRILTGAPDSKILFLSQHMSSEVAQAALDTGAYGYVVKCDAGSELLPAVEAVAQGKPFISARLAGRGLAVTGRANVPQKTRRHELQLCSDESALLDGFACFTTSALEAGSAAIVVTTSSHRPMLHQRLQACGVDVDRVVEEGRYTWLDVADLLSTVTVDGWPDEARFREAAARLVATATTASTCTPARIAACGEGVSTLFREAGAAAAMQLERLWEEFAQEHNLELLCGYLLTTPLHDDEDRIFKQICAEHSAVHRQ